MHTRPFETTAPTRRRLLVTLGAGAGALVTGCVADDRDDGASTDDDQSGTALPDGFPDSCPAYDRVAAVVCYDAVEPASADGYLEPAERTVTPEESAAFRLRNESERELRTNLYDWALHRYADGEWYHIAPQSVRQPLHSIPAGGSHTWSLAVDNEAVGKESLPASGGMEELTVHGLGGGYYAFRGRGWFEGESHEEAVAFAATFELDADPLELVPSAAVEHTEWEDETLVAETSRGDPGEYQYAAFELTRVDEPEAEPETLVTEQVLRHDQLRDALALAREHDADAVRLEEYTSSVPPFGRRPDTPVEFQGATFTISTEELGS